MGLFSLDIERYYKELQGKSQQLKGIFSLQYPIYCIHSIITDRSPDPLDNFDKVIVGFFISNPNLTSFQIACLMGTSKTLIEFRISKLKYDELLTESEAGHILTDGGRDVFQFKTKEREHKRSFDFYLDGLTLEPLPNIYYTNYRSKFVNENDSFYQTSKNTGDSFIVKPFGPDLVHTPPDKITIESKIFEIDASLREQYNIPQGLNSIDEISFTKMSLHILVSVSSKGELLIKELIDGFAFNSVLSEISYYDTLRRNILIFERNIIDTMRNLVFKITMPRVREETKEPPRPILSSNWPEIEKFNDSQNVCFKFSTEDLLKVIEQIFGIKNVVNENIINEDKSVGINISKLMLLESPNRQKLVNDLLRERDYKFGKLDNNVFLLFLYFSTSDIFVNEVLNMKRTLNNYYNKEINLSWLNESHPELLTNYRQLLIAAGEYDILENLDIEKFMLELN